MNTTSEFSTLSIRSPPFFPEEMALVQPPMHRNSPIESALELEQRNLLLLLLEHQRHNNLQALVQASRTAPQPSADLPFGGLDELEAMRGGQWGGVLTPPPHRDQLPHRFHHNDGMHASFPEGSWAAPVGHRSPPPFFSPERMPSQSVPFQQLPNRVYRGNHKTGSKGTPHGSPSRGGPKHRNGSGNAMSPELDHWASESPRGPFGFNSPPHHAGVSPPRGSGSPNHWVGKKAGRRHGSPPTASCWSGRASPPHHMPVPPHMSGMPMSMEVWQEVEMSMHHPEFFLPEMHMQQQQQQQQRFHQSRRCLPCPLPSEEEFQSHLLAVQAVYV